MHFGVTVIILSLGITACSFLKGLPDTKSNSDRNTEFDRIFKAAPLKTPTRVYWNKHQIPFVETGDDSDLAFSLGMIHAHLRLAQMEMVRRISQGRLSEMAGPFTQDIDQALRMINDARHAKRLYKAMPEWSQSWVNEYTSGINFYVQHMKDDPYEFSVLNIERTKWEPYETVQYGRLAATDVNWIFYYSLLSMRGNHDYDRFWRTALKIGGISQPSFHAAGPKQTFLSLLSGLSKSGSNSVVVSAHKSANGSALMANDPHLGIVWPNVWLIAGYKSPSYHAVGFMIPGLPFMALGRNPHIAWGGTNMRSASSDLYDIRCLKNPDLREETHELKTRFWFDKKVKVRRSKVGPVLSDHPFLKGKQGEILALKWTGNEMSDELSAFLQANKARNFRQFRTAFKNYAVSGQNMLYADNKGNIGHVLAVRLPVRKKIKPDKLVLNACNPEDQWTGYKNSTTLPAGYNPAVGFIASANNAPASLKDTGTPVSYFWSSDDRVVRMQKVLSKTGKVRVEDLEDLHLDVYSESAVKLQRIIIEQQDSFGEAFQEAGADAKSLWAAFKEWDGHYRANSKGALAFQLVAYHLVTEVYARSGREAYTSFVLNTERTVEYLIHELLRRPNPLNGEVMAAVLQAAGDDFADYGTWGEFHRQRLALPLAYAPLIGDKFVFAEAPAAGGKTTLYKTAHAFTNEKHFTTYGANARHISVLKNVNENYFILLGGQDGWVNSESAIDQFKLWKEGRYIKVPLEMGVFRSGSVHTSSHAGSDATPRK